MAESPATGLIIEEITGDEKYSLHLLSRALPYRPITISGKQRVEFAWYPGSPVATAQVLGPEEEAITLKGFWKQRFLGEEAMALLDYLPIEVTRELVQTTDFLRRRGQLCRLTWDNIVRVGHITSFEQTWYNGYDCEWSIEFTPISQGEEEQAPSLSTPPRFGDYSATWQNLTPRIVARLENPPYTVYDYIEVGIAELTEQSYALQNSVVATSNSVVTNVVLAPDAINRLGAITESYKVLADTVRRTIYDAADEALFPVLSEYVPDDQSMEAAIEVGLYRFRARADSSRLRNYAITQQLVYDDANNPQLIRTFIAPNDMDLRDVSTTFYGTPNEWRTLMLFNHLGTSKLSAGELVFVPELGSSTNVRGAQA